MGMDFEPKNQYKLPPDLNALASKLCGDLLSVGEEPIAHTPPNDSTGAQKSPFAFEWNPMDYSQTFAKPKPPKKPKFELSSHIKNAIDLFDKYSKEPCSFNLPPETELLPPKPLYEPPVMFPEHEYIEVNAIQHEKPPLFLSSIFSVPEPVPIPTPVPGTKAAEIINEEPATIAKPTAADRLAEDWEAATSQIDGKFEQPMTDIETFHIVEALKQNGYVKTAPRFEYQAEHEARTNSVRYSAVGHRSRGGEQNVVEITEHDGLKKLRGFLESFVQIRGKMPYIHGDHVELGRKAEDMLKNLTFIGQKEYTEAARGLAAYWKDYLDEDPRNQICIPLKISGRAGTRKSDSFLLENILANFSDEEVARYEDRIVDGEDKITQDPEHIKVILLDDWTISGSQLTDACVGLVGNRNLRSCLEINLLVASEGVLESGFASQYDPGLRLPVVAYYKAHHSDVSRYMHKACVTGYHSSVDYDFELEIHRMLDHLRAGTIIDPSNPSKKMPPLTNIVRPYDGTDPRIGLEGGRIKKRAEPAAMAPANC